MKIYYDDSHMGSGKTERAIREIVKSQCKVLFITERIDSFAELENRIKLGAGKYGTAPIIDKVNCAQTDRLGSVSRQIEALPERHQFNDHVIVLATHVGMLRSTFSGFWGWRIIVDEVPPFLDFEEKRTHLDAAFFQAHYQLEAAADGWSFVKATDTGSALSVADVLADQSHDHLAVFHRRVLEATPESSNRCVLVNLPSWDKMSDRLLKWCWASAFSLRELEPFDSVTLLGNRFRADARPVVHGRSKLHELRVSVFRVLNACNGIVWSNDQTPEQKADIEHIVGGRLKSSKSLNFVAGWFLKAVDHISRVGSKAALVSTNTICQGQSVPMIWPLLLNGDREIIFAHTSFKWSNLAANNAGVTVVIVGLGRTGAAEKRIFWLDEEGELGVKTVQNISSYLIAGENVIVQNHTNPHPKLINRSSQRQSSRGPFVTHSCDPQLGTIS